MTISDDTPSKENPSQEGVAGGSSAVFTMKEPADVAGVRVSTLRRVAGARDRTHRLVAYP